MLCVYTLLVTVSGGSFIVYKFVLAKSCLVLGICSSFRIHSFIMNSKGPSIEPWGTPVDIQPNSERV